MAEIQLVPDSNHYQIVGVIRAGLKEVTRPVNVANFEYIGDAHSCTAMSSKFVMAVYISGLRVCRLYR